VFVLPKQKVLDCTIHPYGDTAIRVQLGKVISKEINQKIRSFSTLLEKSEIKGVVEWIPAYTAVTIVYDPFLISYSKLLDSVEQIIKNLGAVELSGAEVITIPTYYGGESGPDLETIANYNQLTTEEVIQIHTSKDYLIYMMGFTPGFPYLGGMSQKIATPRLSSPRAKVAPGSVGIAGEQTGIYSIETPGGWQIIGRTPLRLYDPDRTIPMLLKAGNYLRFESISKEEYDHIKKELKERTYRLKKETL
jgi:inhibitor of KinA